MREGQAWLDDGLNEVDTRTAQRIRVFRLVTALSSAFRTRLDRALAPSGVTSQQAALLQLVGSRATPPSLGEVAQAMNMSHQNVKQLAVALERKGFLKIDADARDRRVRRLAVTPKHHRLWKRRNPHDLPMVAGWTQSLDDEQVNELVSLLLTLARDTASRGS
ncbi:MAG: winged helix DNA-binding protein [Polyangiaceae bacterium]